MNFKEALKTDLSNKFNKKNGIEKREFNVTNFSQLTNRDELKVDLYERNLLLYETLNGEKVYIHYPGQEVKTNKPWDFRPKLIDKLGNEMPDLEFEDIWDDLDSLNNIDNDVLSILASLFFRHSLMIDTVLVDSIYNYFDIDINKNETIRTGTERLRWYKINLDEELIKYLNVKIGKIRGFSFEAYMYYNDLLCQNEDCKYYYRDVIDTPKPGKRNTDIGRLNTYWTHINVIGFLKGNIKFSEIMKSFKYGMGVAPIKSKLIPTITDGIIE